MSGYIGNIPTPQATQTRDTFTATSGQTTFATSGYTPNFVLVWLNGVLLQEGTDYTASNGSDVVLTTGAASGDTLEVVAYSTFELADQTFTGDFSVDSPTFVVDSTNNRVGIGTTSPASGFHVFDGTSVNSPQNANRKATVIIEAGSEGSADLQFLNASYNHIFFGDAADANIGYQLYDHTNNSMQFGVNASERMRIDSNGSLLVGTTNDTPASSNIDGISLRVSQTSQFSVTDSGAIAVNRVSTDGTLISLRQNGSAEGSISVSGTTVSYNGGHLARWSQLPDNTRIDILKGTVMTNLDQMAVWGDEENEQLNCLAVSSVEGDPNVAGVFVNWDDDDEDYVNDMNIAMTGDMIIRIAEGITVQRGDLLMSAGDGTAKPQEDDIVRSKTIAKVTSTHVTCTYDDGSYCVPCVLMAC